MNSWASDLSCTDCNYCWCCLLLTQVNRMSHKKRKEKKREGGTVKLPGWGTVYGGCVGDTKDRAGQCLNVTVLLFAVNYGWGQEYWLCNSAEQTFCRSQWRWQEKKKRGSMFVSVFFFLPPLLSKIKKKKKARDITAGPGFLSEKKVAEKWNWEMC